MMLILMIICWFCIKIFTLKLYHLDFVCLKENVIKDLLSSSNRTIIFKIYPKIDSTLSSSPNESLGVNSIILRKWFFSTLSGSLPCWSYFWKVMFKYFLTLVFTFQSHLLSSSFLTFFKNCFLSKASLTSI